MKRVNTLLALGMISSSLVVAHADNVTFNDTKGHWAEESINTFTSKGFINGYGNNIFSPEGEITRAEFVNMFNKVFNLTQGGNRVFKDTENHWAKNAIDIAVANGVCDGVSDTKFNPDGSITRQEASKMLSNYLKLSDNNVDKLTKFSDFKQVSNWAVTDIEGVIEKGYMNGYPSGEFKPLGTITRAETVSMLSRVIANEIPPAKPILPISFEEFASLLPTLGFDEYGVFWEKNKKMGVVYATGSEATFSLRQNSASFNSVIKDCLNMLLPAGGNKVYNIVSNPFTYQTLEVDGRIITMENTGIGVGIKITNK